MMNVRTIEKMMSFNYQHLIKYGIFIKRLKKYVKERIVVKMRTDIWFSKSSIHVINEILATLQGKRTFTLI